MKDHEDSGLLSEMLHRPHDEVGKRDAILVAALRRYCNGWLHVIRSQIPVKQRRAVDDEDVLQNSLRELDKALQCGIFRDGNGEMIFRHMSCIVRRRAIDAFRKTRGNIGESDIVLPAGNNDGDPIGEMLRLGAMLPDTDVDAATMAQCRELEAEVQPLLRELLTNAQTALAALPRIDRELIACWLQGKPGEPRYEELLRQFQRSSLHEVRKLTLDFLWLPSIAVPRRAIWLRLWESEQLAPGIAARVSIPPEAWRLLTDSRVAP